MTVTGPMTSLAEGMRLRNLTETPAIDLADGVEPMLRREALAARLHEVSRAILAPSTDVRGTRLGPAICCPGRIQIVVHHQPDVHLDVRIFHAGEETIRLKAGEESRDADDDDEREDLSIASVADAVSAFATILRRMDPYEWIRSGRRAEGATMTMGEWWAACSAADGALKDGANVLGTIADPAMPVPVRLVSATPFTRMHAVCMLDGDAADRVERTAAAWTNPPPCLLDVNVRYDERHTTMDVGAASTFGDRLGHIDLMRAMARLEDAGTSR